MRTFWDTSAAVNAALSPKVFRRLETGEHVARLHMLAEFFATMTGRGVEITDEAGNTDRMVFTQNECAAWLGKFAGIIIIVLQNRSLWSACSSPGALGGITHSLPIAPATI